VEPADEEWVSAKDSEEWRTRFELFLPDAQQILFLQEIAFVEPLFIIHHYFKRKFPTQWFSKWRVIVQIRW